jgi:mRNA interferase MazF
LVVSPPEIHDFMRTVIVAPMSTAAKPASFRIPISFEGKLGLVLLDQLRTLDKIRLVKLLGRAKPKTLSKTLAALGEMFAP